MSEPMSETAARRCEAMSLLRLSSPIRLLYDFDYLAFLSACQAANGDEKVPEEAIQVAARMLMAGQWLGILE